VKRGRFVDSFRERNINNRLLFLAAPPARDLGNEKPIAIEFGDEKLMIHNWLPGKPLKVITHGWLGSDLNDSGVFAIKTGDDDSLPKRT